MNASPSTLLRETKKLRPDTKTDPYALDHAARIWETHLHQNAGYDEEWSPIVVHNGRIIDGLRRVRAAVTLGIPQIEVQEYKP